MTNIYQSPEWLSFVATICERPEDDTPRLVAADWLDENGEEERAEFIRWGCANPSETCTFFGQQNTEWSKWPGSQLNQWVIYNFSKDVLFHRKIKIILRRGFIANINGSHVSLILYGPEIVSMNPVEAVKVTDPDPYYIEGQFGPLWIAQAIFPSGSGFDIQSEEREWTIQERNRLVFAELRRRAKEPKLIDELIGGDDT
jgi:uncharacterized protein (TIGR02996 family)